MAQKFSHLFIFLISTFLVLLSLPITESKTSSIKFLKDLKGSKKGDTKTDLHTLKNYLKRLGYLNYNNLKNKLELNKTSYFDDVLEDAIKAYQYNFHLNQTGLLDRQTISAMMKPRCSVSDIILHQVDHIYNDSSHFVTPRARYRLVGKWPDNKTDLTYSFVPGTKRQYKAVIRNAFSRWSDVTRYFTFVQIEDYPNSDIMIGFYHGDHGDDMPFDGRGGMLAHAYYPPSGKFHLDDKELWSTGDLKPDSSDMYSVALHEIGHLLGLGHSRHVSAIMYPIIPYGVAKEIGRDDIRGIRRLYHI